VSYLLNPHHDSSLAPFIYHSFMKNTYERIYEIVKKIPKGRVATYGQVARLAGLGGHARQVGYALNVLPDDQDVPWHRVINARGEISKRSLPVYEQIQKEMLEQEGIKFSTDARVSLRRYRWKLKE